MTWKKFAFLIFDLAVRYWPIVLALVVFLIVGYAFDSCRQASREKKIEKIGANITEQQTIANVLANQKANAGEEVKTNETNSNTARGDLDNSRRTDSGVFAGQSAEDKFCRKFCLDSTCLEWRKRNPGFMCN